MVGLGLARSLELNLQQTGSQWDDGIAVENIDNFRVGVRICGVNLTFLSSHSRIVPWATLY